MEQGRDDPRRRRDRPVRRRPGPALPNGPRDLAALFSRRCDAQALAALKAMDPAPAKIREKIAAGVDQRIEAAMADEAAARRWAGFLALPWTWRWG